MSPFVRMLGIAILATVIPLSVQAFPFGGRITLYHVCYNETLFARLSPPVPGDYVWTTATRTYQFGPPRAAGQWLLGLTGIPFDCLWSVNPIFPVPAIAIMMMGSSQAGGSIKLSSGSYTTDPVKRTWKYPLYTTAAQYDAEEDRLLSIAERNCLADSVPTLESCVYKLQAQEARKERELRFGPRP